jgi:hypothetical protein
LSVGDYVVDQPTGAGGHVEQILEDGRVELRLDNGESVQVQIRPA